MAHLRYLLYVIKHKWYTFVEGCKLGVPWLAIVHDWSRFLPDEWFPRAAFLFGGASVRDSTGYYSLATSENDVYRFSWFLHQKRNKHHWQWWVLPLDDGGVTILPMTSRYRREMLADMRGAGRAQGKPDVGAYYRANKNKMQLHPDTRAWLEKELAVFDDVVEKR